jgi:hypothetical protein
MNIKYQTLILFLTSFCSFSQDYTFGATDVLMKLTGGSISVGEIFMNDSIIGLNSATNLITLEDGKLSVNAEIITTSDSRVKNHITSFGPALKMILKIQPKKYTLFKEQSQGIKMGVLAQDVKKIFPQLVTMDKNKMLAVNYQGLIPLLINSFHELNDKNTELSDRIKNLKKIIAKKN